MRNQTPCLASCTCAIWSAPSSTFHPLEWPLAANAMSLKLFPVCWIPNEVLCYSNKPRHSSRPPSFRRRRRISWLWQTASAFSPHTASETKTWTCFNQSNTSCSKHVLVFKNQVTPGKHQQPIRLQALKAVVRASNSSNEFHHVHMDISATLLCECGTLHFLLLLNVGHVSKQRHPWNCNSDSTSRIVNMVARQQMAIISYTSFQESRQSCSCSH